MLKRLQSGLRPATIVALSIAIVGPVAASAQRTDGARSQYTRLDNCRLIRSSTQDVGFRQSRCAGIGGYALEISSSDGRDELAVVSPGRRKNALNLTGHVGGGFASLGSSAEWRLQGGRPRAVIVRVAVSDDANRAERRTSYLVVASLGARRACIIGRIAPGRMQNARARRLADSGGRCRSLPAS